MVILLSIGTGICFGVSGLLWELNFRNINKKNVRRVIKNELLQR